MSRSTTSKSPPGFGTCTAFIFGMGCVLRSTEKTFFEFEPRRAKVQGGLLPRARRRSPRTPYAFRWVRSVARPFEPLSISDVGRHYLHAWSKSSSPKRRARWWPRAKASWPQTRARTGATMVDLLKGLAVLDREVS